MLNAVLGHLKNYFERENIRGSWRIENGSLTLPFMQEGQFFRVQGSVFNDGVHQYPASDLTDEEFEGIISPMAVPKELLDTVTEIEAWDANNPETAYASESFGGYSYSKATDAGAPITWQGAFRKRLNRWRKL